MEKQDIFLKIYRDIVLNSEYDELKGNLEIENFQDLTISEILEREEKFIDDKKPGNSINFSLAFINKLIKEGIKASIVITRKRNSKLHMSVLIDAENNSFVSDISEDVKYFSKRGIPFKKRDLIMDTATNILWFVDENRNEEINNCILSLKEFYAQRQINENIDDIGFKKYDLSEFTEPNSFYELLKSKNATLVRTRNK